MSIPLEQKRQDEAAGKPSYWGPAMKPSQYAVLHFDVKTMTQRNADLLIFDSLEEAEGHCREKTAAVPNLGCRIYDRAGAIIRTFADERVYAQHHGRPAAKRNLIIGVVCLVTGAACVGLDAWLGWRLTLGVILGVRFLWAGTIKTADGITGLRTN